MSNAIPLGRHKALDPRNRVLIILAAFAIAFLTWTFGRFWIPYVDPTIHGHYLSWLLSGEFRSTQPFLYGKEEIDVYLGLRDARNQTVIDLFFPLFYGAGFLAAFRTMLIALPRQIAQRFSWDVWLFVVPLGVAMCCDWAENSMLLYLMSPASESAGGATVAILPWVTMIKTALVCWTILMLLAVAVLVARRGELSFVVTDDEGN